jgi:uncharacterized cupredoxin-like copper-binding protein
MKHSYQLAALLVIVITFFLFACASQTKMANPVVLIETTSESPKEFNMEFTLKTTTDSGKLAYIGVGGQIDGTINPDLVVQPDDVVRVILVNSDGMPHDLFLPDLDAKTAHVSKIGEQTETVFEMSDLEPNNYIFYCKVPGHRQAG